MALKPRMPPPLPVPSRRQLLPAGHASPDDPSRGSSLRDGKQFIDFAHVLSQGGRDRYRAIAVLMVFQQRDQDSRCRDSGIVERVRELQGVWRRTIANTRPACLEVVKRRDRACLGIGLSARPPRLAGVLAALDQTPLGG